MLRSHLMFAHDVAGSHLTLPFNLIRWLLAASLAFWISLPETMWLLLFLMAADFATGILAASIAQEVSSEECAEGIKKKILVLILIITAHAGSLHLFGNRYHLGAAVSVAYCVNEMISITENCHRGKVPIPPMLIRILAKAKDAAGWSPEDGDRRVAARTDYSGRERRCCALQVTCPLKKNRTVE